MSRTILVGIALVALTVTLAPDAPSTHLRMVRVTTSTARPPGRTAPSTRSADLTETHPESPADEPSYVKRPPGNDERAWFANHLNDK